MLQRALSLALLSSLFLAGACTYDAAPWRGVHHPTATEVARPTPEVYDDNGFTPEQSRRPG